MKIACLIWGIVKIKTPLLMSLLLPRPRRFNLHTAAPINLNIMRMANQVSSNAIFWFPIETKGVCKSGCPSTWVGDGVWCFKTFFYARLVIKDAIISNVASMVSIVELMLISYSSIPTMRKMFPPIIFTSTLLFITNLPIVFSLVFFQQNSRSLWSIRSDSSP